MRRLARWFFASSLLLGTAVGCDSTNTGNGDGGGACRDVVATGSPALIDNLNDNDMFVPNNDGRQGSWFTYGDGTGTQTPAPIEPGVCDMSYLFTPTNGKACMTGTGVTSWGAGLGVGIIMGKNCKSCMYDATIHNGVRFTISGSVTGVVRFQLVTADCHGVQWGGTCADETTCTDCYGATVTVTPDPQVVEIPWSDLRQMGWGPVQSLNIRQVHNLQWEVRLDGTSPASYTDFCVDDVGFY
jgi:hypothetical protein